MTTQHTPYDADLELEKGGPTQNVYVHGMKAGYLRAKADYAPLLEAARLTLSTCNDGTYLSKRAFMALRAAIALAEGRST